MRIKKEIYKICNKKSYAYNKMINILAIYINYKLIAFYRI